MSYISVAQEGLAAVEARQWNDAIDKLSRALKESSNPNWLVARSKALVNVQRFAEALDDANLAWHKAFARGNRPMLIAAQYRRAVAYFRMGQHANADCCCIYAMRLVRGLPATAADNVKAQWTDDEGFWKATPDIALEEAKSDPFNQGELGASPSRITEASKPQASDWRLASALRMQVLGAMAKLPPYEEARKATVSLQPEFKELAQITPARTSLKNDEPRAVKTDEQASVTQSPNALSLAHHDEPLRLQEFQSNATMSVSIFSRGVDKERLSVEFLASAVHLAAVYPNGREGKFTLLPWAEIIPSECKYTMTPNKVELHLAKKTPGKWARLQREERDDAPTGDEAPRGAGDGKGQGKDVASTVFPAAEPQPPASGPKPEAGAPATSYPTSARGGPKNCDRIGNDEVGDEEEEGDVNMFFKKLYKNATPEQQRAMMKSFTESNGTSLSTDWNDVKGRKVETVPPEGVEAKKWE